MLEKHKILYLILGIGMGIILTSTLYMIYPKIEYIHLSDDMIIERARDLGMVSLKENIKIEKKTDDNLEKNDEVDISDEPEIEVQTELEPEPEPEIEKEIRIEYGWSLTRVALELYEKEVIANKEEFINYVKGKRLSTKIRVGTHTFKNNPSYDEIIEIITIGSK